MTENPWAEPLGIWNLAERHPELPAVIDSPTGVTLTFGELAGRSHQIVHALRSRGIGKDHIVAYALPNGVDMLYWILSLQESGIHAIALNPALSVHEIRTVLEHSGAKALVLHADYADAPELARTTNVGLKISVGGDLEGFESYEAFVEGQPLTVPEDRSFGSPISYSSGTTGQPKAIARPNPPGDPTVIADKSKVFAQAFQFQPFEGVHLVSAGMHHGGCQGFYLGALTVGQPLVIMGKFDPEGTLERIERFKVTTAYMVPTQFVRLLRLSDEIKATYDVSSLEVVVHSAAPCPMEVKKAMFDWWGPVIWETYGGMEGAAAIAKPKYWLERPGTVGRAVRGVEIKILDDEGNELGVGETGNVFIQTQAAFEYRNDPDLTASVHRGKFFTIGDVGFLDEDGFLFLRDRAKDMIISGGVNIYPAEIEGVLLTHDLVGDAAVIGLPDPEWGERVHAVIELTEGVEGSDELSAELMAFCRTKLAGFKCPRSIDFTDELPRTETGKLLKRRLRDEYAAQAESS